MIKDFEKKFNNRLLDWILGGSYLGNYRQRFFKKSKKIGHEAYVHILDQIENFTKRYRN